MAVVQFASTVAAVNGSSLAARTAMQASIGSKPCPPVPRASGIPSASQKCATLKSTRFEVPVMPRVGWSAREIADQGAELGIERDSQRALFGGEIHPRETAVHEHHMEHVLELGLRVDEPSLRAR